MQRARENGDEKYQTALVQTNKSIQLTVLRKMKGEKQERRSIREREREA